VRKDLLVVCLALAPLLLPSCGPKPFIDAREASTLKDDSGATVSWTPKRPAIGDLVRIEASIPGEDGEALSLPSGYPDPDDASPLSIRRLLDSRLLRWSFRVKSPGEYRLGSHILFAAESVAKDGTELKTADANALWAGTASRNAKLNPSDARSQRKQAAGGATAP
jgi:hypothetical protein